MFVVLSVVMAAYKISFIVNMMAFSWGALAGFFLAPYIYGLFYKKATMAGAVAASFTGLAIAVLVPILWRFPLPDGGLIAVAKSPAIPVASAAAMIIPLIVLPLVSSLTRKLPKEHVEHVFGADEEATEEGSTAKAVAN